VRIMGVIGFCIRIHHLYVDYCISPMGPEAMDEKISTIFVT
jgi:hypothetical protein